MTNQLITRDFHNATIRQRYDGYLSATDMCQANNKRFGDYKRLKNTKEFFNALSRSVGIPTDLIIQITRKGLNNKRGTWIEPHAAINLAQWCSPEFAAMVTEWVFELLKTGTVSLNSDKPNQDVILFAQTKATELDKLGIVGNAKQISLNNSIKQQFNCDMLAIFGIESQPSEIQQALLNPIAERVSLRSAVAVNKELITLRLQTKHYDKKNVYYELTKKGMEYGQYQDTGIRKISKTIRIVKWYEKVLELFQPALSQIS